MAILSAIGLNLLISAALYRPFIAAKQTKQISLTVHNDNMSTVCEDLIYSTLKPSATQTQSYGHLNIRSEVQDTIIANEDGSGLMLTNSTAKIQNYSASNNILEGINTIQEVENSFQPLLKHSRAEIKSYSTLNNRSDHTVHDSHYVFDNIVLPNSNENLGEHKDNISLLAKPFSLPLTYTIEEKMSAKQIKKLDKSLPDGNHLKFNLQHKANCLAYSCCRCCKNRCAAWQANECVQSIANLSFIMFELSVFLVVGTLCASPTLLVAHVQTVGIDESSAVYLLALLGIADLLGCIISGLIYDHALIISVRNYIYIIVLFLFGLAAITYGFCVSFVSFAINSVCIGFFIGAIYTGMPIFLTDLVDIEYRNLAFGLTLFCEGIGALIEPMIAGIIYLIKVYLHT